MNCPFISIIVPVRNAQNTIKKCIDSLLDLNYPNYELIVVNDGSTDDTAKVLANYQNIKILTTHRVGPSQARNLALGEAKGAFVAFTDADCIVGSVWIAELLKGFVDDRVAGVGGIQKIPADAPPFSKKVQEFLSTFGFISDYMKSGLSISKTRHNPSCNVMYRKSVLVELGGFFVGLWPGEDVELDYRIKRKDYQLMFNPQAVVYHYRPNNFSDFSKMMFGYGMAQGWLVKKYGIFRAIHFVPLIVLMIILLSFYNLFLGTLIFTLILTLVFIKLFIVSSSPFLILLLFWDTIFTWNLGFLYGLFKRRLT